MSSDPTVEFFEVLSSVVKNEVEISGLKVIVMEFQQSEQPGLLARSAYFQPRLRT